MELVKQISVFVENTEGALAHITTILAGGGVNLRAMSLADTTDFGILRLIVPDPEKAVKILSEHDIMVKSTDVIVVEISDSEGGLNKPLCLLSEKGITVEYIYAFLSKKANLAHVIMKTNDAETAVSTLTAGGVRVLPEKEVYAL